MIKVRMSYSKSRCSLVDCIHLGVMHAMTTPLQMMVLCVNAKSHLASFAFFGPLSAAFMLLKEWKSRCAQQLFHRSVY